MQSRLGGVLTVLDDKVYGVNLTSTGPVFVVIFGITSDMNVVQNCTVGWSDFYFFVRTEDGT